MKFIKVMTAQGVPIYAYHVPYAKSTTVAVLVKTGTRDELWPEEAGLAHAVEHMVFRGTADFSDSKSLSAYIENIGGEINAHTSKECTWYESYVPSTYVKRAIYSLSQIVRKPLFRTSDIEPEMKVIVQELLSYNDLPEELSVNKYIKEIFGKHPLSFDSLGLKDSVLNFQKKDFKKWHDKFYRPDNLVFIVTSNLKIAQIKKLFEKYFPEKVTSKSERKFFSIEKPTKTYKHILHHAEQAHINFGTLTPGVGHPDNWPLEVFKTMIDGGSSSPLWQEIREKRGLAYSVAVRHWLYKESGLLMIQIETDPHKVEEAIKISLGVIKKAKSSSKLMNIAKKMLIGESTLLLDDRESCTNMIINDVNLFDKVISLEEKINKIKAVTIEQISEVVEKYLLDESRRVTVVLGPKNK